MRAEQLAGEFSLEMELWAFDLRPGVPPEGILREAIYSGSHSSQRSHHVREMAAEAGLDLTTPRLVVNTHKAHEATEFAKGAGKAREFQRALFRAYWGWGANLGDVDVLCRLAEECQLDPADLRGALEEGRFAAAVDEQIRWSHSVGITGIPTFVFDDKYALVGAQPYEVFRSLAQRLLKGDLKT